MASGDDDGHADYARPMERTANAVVTRLPTFIGKDLPRELLAGLHTRFVDIHIQTL